MYEMLDDLFQHSLKKFFEIEAAYIRSGVSERSLCARLAMVLEPKCHEAGLTGYYADIENNRKQEGKIKTILDEDNEVIDVTCDLILHSRGEMLPDDNLIAIEMKRETKVNKPSAEDKEKDKRRLRALTKFPLDDIYSTGDIFTHPEHVCGYKLGYFIDISIPLSLVKVEIYHSGRQVREYDFPF